jgi:hypothetical protein
MRAASRSSCFLATWFLVSIRAECDAMALILGQ